MSTAALPSSAGSRPGWPHRLPAALERFAAWLARPRVRVVVVGVLLLMIGALVVTSSVWTLPLVIVGAAMVLVAWVGSRLDGHFAVEWGERGTEVQFRARIRPASSPARPALPAPTIATVSAPAPADVVEGEAHTVEIDVAELKALIAAAEAEQASGEVARAALRLVSEREAG